MSEAATTGDHAITYQQGEKEIEIGGMESSEEKSEKSLVVPSEEANRFFTVAFADASMANVIPVSIEKSTGTENINELIKAYNKLNLENIGLYKPPFYNNMVVEENRENNEAIVYLTSNENLSSSAESQWFEKLFRETIKWSPYDRLQIEGSTNIKGDLLSGINEIVKKQEKKAYLKYETDTGEKYLMPSEQAFNTVEEAFDSMKNVYGSEQVKPLLPADVSIESVQRQGHELIIHFSDIKEQIHPSDELTMVEGILLTAKDFGFEQVLFTNLNKSRIGTYDVTKPIDVPAAPNPIDINR